MPTHAGSDGEVERANGQILAFGAVAVDREGEGTYRISLPIAIEDGVALASLRLTGAGVRNWNVEWFDESELVIYTYDAATGEGGPLDTDFSIIITGKF